MGTRAEPLHVSPHALRIGQRLEALLPPSLIWRSLLRRQSTGEDEDE
jgi:hypothetical protein